MSKLFSLELANEIKEFLEEDDWNFSFEEDRGLFRFGLGLRTKLKKIDYVIDVKENDYFVYAICPLSADENDPKQMKEMAEFMCRANYSLTNGNFEFDFNDGEIRFKSYVNCKDCMPSQAIIRDSIYFPAQIYHTYSPGLLQILFNDMPAVKAIKLCEKNNDSDDENKDEQDMSKYLSDLMSQMQENDDSSKEDEE